MSFSSLTLQNQYLYKSYIEFKFLKSPLSKYQITPMLLPHKHYPSLVAFIVFHFSQYANLYLFYPVCIYYRYKFRLFYFHQIYTHFSIYWLTGFCFAGIQSRWTIKIGVSLVGQGHLRQENQIYFKLKNTKKQLPIIIFQKLGRCSSFDLGVREFGDILLVIHQGIIIKGIIFGELMQSPTSLPYIFCHAEHRPRSLVMLSSAEHIISSMFEPVENQFVWFDCAPLTPPHKLFLSQMEKELDIHIHYFNNAYEMDSFLAKDKKKCFVFISSQPTLNLVERIGKKYDKQVKGGIIYPYSSSYVYVPTERQLWGKDPTENTNSYQNRFLQATDQQKLKQLAVIHRKKQSSYQLLPNFILLSDNIFASNVIVKTMQAMLKQQITPQTRRQIVAELEKLLRKVAQVNRELQMDQDVLDEFLNQLRQKKLSKQRTIFWYTQQSVIYKFMNNLFRSSKHPTELYYIQPFFKDLFQAILQLQNRLSEKQGLQEFVCYRGGQATEQQIHELANNVGEFVQNLGFLSTSLCPETANIYIRNIFFEIVVKNSKNQQGFAWIAEHSYFYEEQEIVFNPLNSFKIMEVSIRQQDKRELYYIKLSFGQLTTQAEKNQKLLSKKQKIYFEIKKIQEKKHDQFNQGIILTNIAYNLKGSPEYWQKFASIASSNQDKQMGLRYRGYSEMNEGNYKKALVYFNEQNEILQELMKYFGMPEFLQDVPNLNNYENLSVFSISKYKYQNKNICEKYLKNYSKKQRDLIELYFINLSNKALAYQFQGLFNNSFELFKKALHIKLKTSGLLNQEIVGIFNNIAAVYQRKKEWDKSLQFYQKSNQIGLIALSDYDPCHLFTLNNMANIYQEKKDHEKSFQLYQKCIEVQLKILGQNHPSYANSLSNLATTFQDQGKLQLALQISQKAFQIRLKMQGQNHPNHSIGLNGIANIYAKLGKYDDALNFFQKSQAIKVKFFQGDHSSYLTTLINIAHVYAKKFQFQTAIRHLRSAGKIALQNLGRSDSLYGQILGSLVNFYHSLGDFDKFCKFSRAYALILEKDNKMSSNYEKFLWFLASVYESLKQFRKQKNTFLRLCKKRQKYRQLDSVYKTIKRNAEKTEIKLKNKTTKKLNYIDFH